jgi:hypothetical protein
MTASPSMLTTIERLEACRGLDPGFVHPETPKFVAVLQEPKCFADDLARRRVAPTAYPLLDELLEFRRQRHVHEHVLRAAAAAHLG